MRTCQEISAIQSHITDPVSIENFISNQEVDYLVTLYENTDNLSDPYVGKIKKNTGPVTLDIRPFLYDPVIETVMDRIRTLIGPFEITAGLFFRTDYPHIIHNDDTFELPETVYKAITIPLKVYGEAVLAYPYLCFFDQMYFHGPAKFFKGEESVPTYYNKQIYDYRDVCGLKQDAVNDELYNKYFTHLKRSWLEGLSLHSVVKWVPTSAVVFDSVRLHCASDFRKQNIKAKLAISIFTKKCKT